ncbi:MAG: HNH endonuclease [Solirubrobacterales bacterium]|nr:HNH endonuclease [Solirubrobacterales bacterium]
MGEGAGVSGAPPVSSRGDESGSISGSNGSAALNGAGGSNGQFGRPHRLSSRRVLVLNASYEPLNVCTVRRALVLILKQKAEVLENGSGVLRSETMRLDMPEVIRLVTFVRVPRDIHRRRITRKAVLARDGWICQYCGAEKPALTVDHVIPRSRGGKSVWENIVASCASCNHRKGNRLPHEIRMHPRNRPRPPGPTVFIRIAAPRTPVAWEPYLP